MKTWTQFHTLQEGFQPKLGEVDFVVTFWFRKNHSTLGLKFTAFFPSGNLICFIHSSQVSYPKRLKSDVKICPYIQYLYVSKTCFQVFSLLQRTLKREIAPHSHPWTSSVPRECWQSSRWPSSGIEVGSWNFPGLSPAQIERLISEMNFRMVHDFSRKLLQ